MKRDRRRRREYGSSGEGDGSYKGGPERRRTTLSMTSRVSWCGPEWEPAQTRPPPTAASRASGEAAATALSTQCGPGEHGRTRTTCSPGVKRLTCGPFQAHDLVRSIAPRGRVVRRGGASKDGEGEKRRGGERGAALLRMGRGRGASPQITAPVRQCWPSSLSHVTLFSRPRLLTARGPRWGHPGADGTHRRGSDIAARDVAQRRTRMRRSTQDAGDQDRERRSWAVPVRASDQSRRASSPRATDTLRGGVSGWTIASCTRS